MLNGLSTVVLDAAVSVGGVITPFAEIEKLSMELPLADPPGLVVTQLIPKVCPLAIESPFRVKEETAVVAGIPLVPVALPVKSLPSNVVLEANAPVPLQSHPAVFTYLNCL